MDSGRVDTGRARARKLDPLIGRPRSGLPAGPAVPRRTRCFTAFLSASVYRRPHHAPRWKPRGEAACLERLPLPHVERVTNPVIGIGTLDRGERNKAKKKAHSSATLFVRRLRIWPIQSHARVLRLYFGCPFLVPVYGCSRRGPSENYVMNSGVSCELGEAGDTSVPCAFGTQTRPTTSCAIRTLAVRDGAGTLCACDSTPPALLPP